MARPRQRLGNLPAEATSFVGRRRELAEIRKRLTTARLISLVGPGGVGKTRLSLEAMHRLAPRFNDDVAFCDLTTAGAVPVWMKTPRSMTRVEPFRTRRRAPSLSKRMPLPRSAIERASNSQLCHWPLPRPRSVKPAPVSQVSVVAVSRLPVRSSPWSQRSGGSPKTPGSQVTS